MLHIIKTQSGLDDAIHLIQTNDDVLLLEDAVYALFRQSSSQIAWKDQKDHCWALKEDLMARGLTLPHELIFQVVDFDGFVSLTEQHLQSITWD